MTVQKGRYRLSDMEFDFVSLVPAGDDPMAQVVIAKAAPEGQSLYVPDALGAPCPDCGRTKNHRRGCKTVNKSTESGLPDSTLSASNDFMEDTMPDSISKDGLAPEVVAYIDALEAEADTLAAQIEKAEADLAAKDDEITGLRDTLSKSAPKDEESAEAIQQALLAKADPAVRSLIEKAQADAKRAEEVAKAERDARLQREFIAKAETLPMVSEDKGALAGLLRRMAEALTPEDNAAVEKILKAANDQIATSGLFSEFGTGGGETTISKSVEAAANEIMKADPSLTRDQAMAKVYEQNPDLFAQAMTGQEG